MGLIWSWYQVHFFTLNVYILFPFTILLIHPFLFIQENKEGLELLKIAIAKAGYTGKVSFSSNVFLSLRGESYFFSSSWELWNFKGSKVVILLRSLRLSLEWMLLLPSFMEKIKHTTWTSRKRLVYLLLHKIMDMIFFTCFSQMKTLHAKGEFDYVKGSPAKFQKHISAMMNLINLCNSCNLHTLQDVVKKIRAKPIFLHLAIF